MLESASMSWESHRMTQADLRIACNPRDPPQRQDVPTAPERRQRRRPRPEGMLLRPSTSPQDRQQASFHRFRNDRPANRVMVAAFLALGLIASSLHPADAFSSLATAPSTTTTPTASASTSAPDSHHPIMLLDPYRFALGRHPFRIREDGPPRQRRRQQQKQQPNQPQSEDNADPNQKLPTRVLGFDIALFARFKTTHLSASTSSVDVGSWNDGFDDLDADINEHVERQLQTDADPNTNNSNENANAMWLAHQASRSDSTVAKIDTASTETGPNTFFPPPGLLWDQKEMNSSSQTSPSLPDWFPWTPTRAQIDMLKVSELKEASPLKSSNSVQSGNKSILQDRLWEWTSQQQEQHHARLSLERGWIKQNHLPKAQTPGAAIADEAPPNDKYTQNESERRTFDLDAVPNSLQEWIRNLDVEALMRRRKKIKRENMYGKVEAPKKTRDMTPTKEYLSGLARTFQESSARVSSNVEARELYNAAKQADQLGERTIARELLETLVEATPNDARLYRRLSRMAAEDGKIGEAKDILLRGTKQQPESGFLWHGLGQLELKYGSEDDARRYFQKAILVDPDLPHPYHALATFEHSKGRIAQARSVLYEAVKHCPANHRLHHALGDLYRDSGMLPHARRWYQRALESGPAVSHGFALSALAAVAYEDGEADCRYWLRQAVAVNQGRHAQGWVALSQFEESEGNIEAARAACVCAAKYYERGLLQSYQRYRTNFRKQKNLKLNGNVVIPPATYVPPQDLPDDPIERKNHLLRLIPHVRSGDKFLMLYQRWIDLEKRYGSPSSVNEVFERATIIFPQNYRLTLDWAEFLARATRNHAHTRKKFVEACQKVGDRHADPFRLHAEFEMARGEFVGARRILYNGAQIVMESPDGDLSHRRGLAELFHTWAICEWHMRNVPRAEVLFDHALRMTADNATTRTKILFSIATLEYHRGELLLAQHCIGLCLKESGKDHHRIPHVWHLWAQVATDMGNEKLALSCLEQAANKTIDLDRLTTTNMQHMLRREPWKEKLPPNEYRSLIKLPPKNVMEVQGEKMKQEEEHEPTLTN